MKNKNLPIVIILILVVIFVFFMSLDIKPSITGKATEPICSGSPPCNYPNSISCNSHCACSWVGEECTAIGCSECVSEVNCEDSGCTWMPAQPFCGDEVIDVGEDCDGGNLGGETCVSQGFERGTLSCSSCEFDTDDCVVPETCGDGTCQNDETCSSCPGDCGQCSTAVVSEGGGGGGAENVLIAPKYPLDADIISYGPLELKVQVYYGDDPSNSAIVKANSSMFNEVNLRHTSGLPTGIYTANITMAEDIEIGKQRITYTATQGGQLDEVSILVELKSGLDIEIGLEDKYFKGDKISFNGTVLDLNGTPEADALIEIFGYKENRIFYLTTKANEKGHFSIDYFIKYADPEGVWDIVIDAASESGCRGRVSFSPEVDVPQGVIYYAVNFLSPLQGTIFDRGETIPISVEVKSIEGDLIENSSLVIYTLKDETIALEEVAPGIYSGNYLVEPDDLLGIFFLKAEAVKETDGVRRVGGASLPLQISSTEIKIDLISPLSAGAIYTGSRLKIRAKLIYPDGSLVKGASSNAFLSNGEIIPLLEKSDGVYLADYSVKTSDIGTLKIEIRAEDAEDNFGILKQSLAVRRSSFIGRLISYVFGVLRKYWGVILLFLVVVGFLSRRAFEIKWADKKLKKAREEINRVKVMQADAEKRYYKEGSITKGEFKDLMIKYEERFANARENQKIYKKVLVEKIKKLKKGSVKK
ncbi:MAG: hypothetical protein ABIH59_02560 [archaeon]